MGDDAVHASPDSRRCFEMESWAGSVSRCSQQTRGHRSPRVRNNSQVDQVENFWQTGPNKSRHQGSGQQRLLSGSWIPTIRWDRKARVRASEEDHRFRFRGNQRPRQWSSFVTAGPTSRGNGVRRWRSQGFGKFRNESFSLPSLPDPVVGEYTRVSLLQPLSEQVNSFRRGFVDPVELDQQGMNFPDYPCVEQPT
jgi:hypothetical protein